MHNKNSYPMDKTYKVLVPHDFSEVADNAISHAATVAKSFKIGSLPLVVLIDESGNIVYVNAGQDAKMDKSIRDILDSKS